MPKHTSKKTGLAAAAGDSLSLNEADPKLGDRISFTYSTADPVPAGYNLRISVQAFQNGVVTYSDACNADEQDFTLGHGSEWTSGPAHLVAQLFESKLGDSPTFWLTETQFDAAG